MSVTVIFRGRTPKEGEAIHNCQDALAIDEEKTCFAIADGASQSFYPSIWAKYLVDRFCQYPEINQDNWQIWLQPIQNEWLENVSQRVKISREKNNPVWIGNQNHLNLKHSATSTFIGVQLLNNKIKITIVGDSCLFICNHHRLIESYPLRYSQEFNDRPKYFASYNKDNDFPPQIFTLDLERYFPEEIYLILATDALSEYIFKCIENQKDILSYLLKINQQEDFEKFVSLARNADEIKMKNDDVTLLTIGINHDKKSPIFLPQIPEIIGYSSPNEEFYNSDNDNEKNQDDLISIDKPDLIPETNIITDDNEIPVTEKKPISNNKNQSVNVLRSFLVSMIEKLEKIINDNKANLEKQPLGLFILFLLLLSSNVYFLASISSKNTKLNDLTETLTQKEIELTKAKQEIENIKETYKIISLQQESKIYQDNTFSKILIDSLANSIDVLVIEEKEDYLKFRVNFYSHNLYIHQSTLNDGKNCESNQIEIKAGANIRLLPVDILVTLVGKLNNNLKVKTMPFNEISDWCKFQFEGYIEK